MAAAAKLNCYCCGEPVAVNLNRANRAYYHCGHCGLSVTSKGNESTEHMLKKNVVPTKNTTTATTPASSTTASKPTEAAPVAKKSTFKTLMDATA